jgi:hypothetical protein
MVFAFVARLLKQGGAGYGSVAFIVVTLKSLDNVQTNELTRKGATPA